MRDAGMHTWIDNTANVHGRIDGKLTDAPVLLLGSHYDTVIDAGKYDGALGIICAIAAVKALLLQANTFTLMALPHLSSEYCRCDVIFCRCLSAKLVCQAADS